MNVRSTPPVSWAYQWVPFGYTRTPHPLTTLSVVAASLFRMVITSESNFFPLGTAFVFLAVVLYLRSVAQWKARTRGRPLPPGPKPLPVLGNIFNMPRSRQWIAYRDLGRVFGE